MTPLSTVHRSLPTLTHPVRSVPLNNDTQFSPGAFGAAAGPDCARATVARAQTSTHEFASCFIMAGSVTRLRSTGGTARTRLRLFRVRQYNERSIHAAQPRTGR